MTLLLVINVCWTLANAVATAVLATLIHHVQLGNKQIEDEINSTRH